MTLFLGHYDITIPFYFLFAAAFINAVFYLYGQWKLVRYIKENRKELYEKLGRPVTRIKRYYSPEEIKASLLKTKYILFGDFREIPDEKLRRLAERLRFSAFFHLAALCLIMCTMSFTHTSRSTQSKRAGSGMISAAYNTCVQGNCSEALEMLNQVLEKHPGDFSGHYYRAFVFEKIKQYDKALNDLVECARARPDSLDVFLHIDWILSRRSRWDEVVRYWNIYINTRPDDARAYLERGGAYWHMQDIEHAISDARKACELGSTEGCRRYQQARVRAENL